VIVSEFPSYTFESLASYTRTKLEILYNEALRQRTSKSFFIAQQVNTVHMDKKDQKRLNKQLDSYMNPYRKVVETDNSGWEELRNRGRR
jgi:hypothetical protein